ncbi:SUMF1/EgtB/PvdO family nonheme iron enzyme [Chondromyces apiculatus]|uniref:SUMF1/EgtB/PvdO family nonheme iron enzyme n=1 Tax=Chondromyces apiculatus TaxID=51 RepID=UPI000694628B|nr:SUMF1/EgtB/PvdO family nonheme iron enzyme [Chondromyces apiculatus]
MLGIVVGGVLAAMVAGCSVVVDLSGLADGASPGEGGQGPGGASGVGGAGGTGASGTGSGDPSSSGSAGGGGSGGMGTGSDGCPTGRGPTMVRVDIAPEYCIDSTEVTMAQYLEFVDASVFDTSILGEQQQDPLCAWNVSLEPPSNFTTYWDKLDDEDSQINDPVRYVDWCDAKAYCAWAGKRLCGARAGGALPSTAMVDSIESQWFHACSRGDTRTYPFGEVPAGSGNAPSGHCVDGRPNDSSYGGLYNTTEPVGSFTACEGGFDGIFDMSGNVSEWVDACDITTADPMPGEPGADDLCPVQGGMYGFLANATFCGFIQKWRRDAFGPAVGFRCCSP